LTGDGLLVVRDDDGIPNVWPDPIPAFPITIEQQCVMDASSVLRMVFDADAWNSTISFASRAPVTRGGTLELLFAPDVDVTGQVGRTLRVFDWTGIAPTGTFQIVSSYSWDTSKLYTTGEITLTAVPEPSSVVLGLSYLGLICASRRRARGMRQLLSPRVTRPCRNELGDLQERVEQNRR
jgi:hypothetical protein